MAIAHSHSLATRPTRRLVVRGTYALAAVAAVSPLFVTVALLEVAGVLFVLAGLLRLAFALAEEQGPSRLAGLTAVALGVTLLVVSGQGIWSLPVMFAIYLGVEAVLRLVQAVRRDNLRLYTAGLLAALIGVAIWQDIFCGGYALFGPTIGLDLAAGAWAFAERPRPG